MKFYVLAGEPSGDLHGANLVKALRTHFPDSQFVGYGGEKMQSAGVELRRDYKQMAFMGLTEVLLNLPTILRILAEAKRDIRQSRPDAVILIDYPSFNMRVAKFAKKEGIPVFYYISPKLWAWNRRRAVVLKKNVDALFSILPFEVEFFKQYQFEQVYYVGNPLFDAIAEFRTTPRMAFCERHGISSEKPILALLPGSRKQELLRLLPEMVQLREQFTDYQLVVAGVSHLPQELYEPAHKAQIPIIYEDTYSILHHAALAVVASGTATLETALFGVPQVVVYKTSWFTYEVGKRLIRVPFISLVNLIAGKEVVVELIQQHCSSQRISEELRRIETQTQAQIQTDYRQLRQQLETEGVSLRTAHIIKSLLSP
jgi:lipid-A-disaccharide synthase